MSLDTPSVYKHLKKRKPVWKWNRYQTISKFADRSETRFRGRKIPTSSKLGPWIANALCPLEFHWTHTARRSTILQLSSLVRINLCGVFLISMRILRRPMDSETFQCRRGLSEHPSERWYEIMFIFDRINPMGIEKETAFKSIRRIRMERNRGGKKSG